MMTHFMTHNRGSTMPVKPPVSQRSYVLFVCYFGTGVFSAFQSVP